MSSVLQETLLDVQITEARAKGSNLIVNGIATAVRFSIDTSSEMKPMEPIDTSDWYVDEEIDPLPGSPIGPDFPGVNEDQVEDLTSQIQEVAVSIQIGTGAPGPFEQAVPAGPNSAEWADWRFNKQLPSFSLRQKITIIAKVRMGTKTDTFTTQISRLPQLAPTLSLVRN